MVREGGRRVFEPHQLERVRSHSNGNLVTCSPAGQPEWQPAGWREEGQLGGDSAWGSEDRKKSLTMRASWKRYRRAQV